MIIEVDILSCHRVINVTEQLLLYVSLSFKQKHDWWLQQYNHNVLANFIIWLSLPTIKLELFISKIGANTLICLLVLEIWSLFVVVLHLILEGCC